MVVSIGHSNATYEQAVQAYAHGARSMTHVYNAMTPLRIVQMVLLVVLYVLEICMEKLFVMEIILLLLL